MQRFQASQECLSGPAATALPATSVETLLGRSTVRADGLTEPPAPATGGPRL
jgi:hypothetical protein